MAITLRRSCSGICVEALGALVTLRNVCRDVRIHIRGRSHRLLTISTESMLAVSMRKALFEHSIIVAYDGT